MNMKLYLKTVSNWNWDKIANISVVIGVFLAILTFCHSNKQFNENIKNGEQLFKKDSLLLAKQIELSQEPIIRIIPENEVEGEIANFNLKIKNYSPSKLVNIQIFTDYFVAIRKKNENISLISFGTISTHPNVEFSNINAFETESFNISFNNTLKQMLDFYNSDFSGQRMMVVRLTVKYDRNLDGQRYIYKKVYIIAGHGDYLLDTDERGIRAPIDIFNLEDIKRIIGTND